MSSHTDASKKCLHFIHKLYIHSDNTSIFLQPKTTDLIVPKVLVPLLHPLILLQQELSYLPDTAEDQNIAKTPSYRVLLSKIISSLSPLQNFSSLLLPKTAALSAV